MDIAALVDRIAGLSDEQKAVLHEAVMQDPVAGAKWVPTVGPQYDAYISDADVLLYGGQAGGGKSGLIIGLALMCHKRSLLMRRQYTDLGALIEDCLEKYGSRNGYSGAPPARLRTDDGRLIEFGAAKQLGDEQHWRGQPHDLLAIDEASQFDRSQVDFLMGWLRSDDESQRCRVLLASNPPENPAQGEWLKQMFGPWLDDQHPLYKAEPGHLLWCVSDEEGKDRWVDGPEPIEIGGKTVNPLSRTFIPAALSDNPFLAKTGYEDRLASLPEPLRSAVRDGNWMISHEDDRYQVIPTNWVLKAQQRWTREPPDAPMCVMGVDVAQGGSNNTVIAPRHDGWYAEPIVVPGKDTPEETDVAALVIKHRRHGAKVVIDRGGGYGAGALGHLKSNGIEVYGFKGAEGSSRRTEDRQLAFYNKRAEAWWRFREALDPDQEGGSPIALPYDSGLVADLTAPRFDTERGKIQVESKKDIIKRLGRSPDKGDAVVMAWSYGATYVTHGKIWRETVKTIGRPAVSRGHMNKRRKRH